MLKLLLFLSSFTPFYFYRACHYSLRLPLTDSTPRPSFFAPFSGWIKDITLSPFSPILSFSLLFFFFPFSLSAPSTSSLHFSFRSLHSGWQHRQRLYTSLIFAHIPSLVQHTNQRSNPPSPARPHLFAQPRPLPLLVLTYIHNGNPTRPGRD